MNKITQKHEFPIDYVNLNKAETDSFRHKMIMKTSHLLTKDSSVLKFYPQPIIESNIQQKSIFIKKEAYERTLSVYQWRYKTCYPVLKPLHLTVKSFTGSISEKKKLCKKNSQSPFEIWNLDENIYELLVTTQKTNFRLSELASLSLPQIFYLLKEILVGFQCLIDIFGIFQPTEDMIAVNEMNEWRFWISEDFASNSKKQSNISEAEFILKILKMVETRLPKSKVAAKFFQELKNLPAKSLTFLNLLNMTNTFISLNKIIVAKKFVSSHLKIKHGMRGSKNSSYFQTNRTFYEFKQSQRNSHNNSKGHIDSNSQVIQHQSAKHIPRSPKFNSKKSLYECQFSHKLITSQSISRQNQLKIYKQPKSRMKISQFYSAERSTHNKIEKKGSFMLTSLQTRQKEEERQILPQKQKTSIFTPKPCSFYHSRTQKFQQGNINKAPFKRQRKLSVEINLKIHQNTSQNLRQSQTQQIQHQHIKKQRKNSYYNYQKPINKQAFSDSPNKSSSKNISFEENDFIKETDQEKNKKVFISKIPQRENILMNEKTITRPRKYSEHGQKIKSLDQFVKKNKKMFESSTIGVKEIRYGNLKSKDIDCHNRHATISEVAFGGLPKNKNNGLNNINNDLYNGKFEEIMKSLKSRSNQEKNEEKDDFKGLIPRSTKRRATLFEIVRQIPETKQEDVEHCRELSPKPEIRVSHLNNQTAETLNKSEMNIVKGSQQSLSNNNNISNIRQSDTNSNDKSAFNQNKKGLISKSNLSNFSSKTYQPVKEKISGKQQKQRQKQMAISQDCFNVNNQKESEQSEQFMKSNQWKKNIEGLFSDVASIKVLKQSGHFGEELELFEKDYLKNVKLEKLDKLGKQLKGSILEQYDYEEGSQVLNVPMGGLNNKTFSLIGQVKQEAYENDPSCLQYSTSMICQSRLNEINSMGLTRLQTKAFDCESLEQIEQEPQPNNIVSEGFNLQLDFQSRVNDSNQQ